MTLDTFIVALQNSFGNHLPQILGALAIFALGWLIAVVARAGTMRLLSLLGLNRRITESTGVEVDTERPIALGVFWLLILVTVIAVLNVLDLSTLSGPFASMMTDILGYLPHLLAGVVLTLVAWLIASLLRGALVRVMAASKIDERLSAKAGMAPMSRSAGNVLFWLVLLLFLPAVLGAFQLTGTLGPVQSMLSDALALLPNIFAAAVDRLRRLCRGARAARAGDEPAGRGRRRFGQRAGRAGQLGQAVAPGRHAGLPAGAGAVADRGARRAAHRGRLAPGVDDAGQTARRGAAHHRGRRDPAADLVRRALRGRAAGPAARERRLRRAARAPGPGPCVQRRHAAVAGRAMGGDVLRDAVRRRSRRPTSSASRRCATSSRPSSASRATSCSAA